MKRNRGTTALLAGTVVLCALPADAVDRSGFVFGVGLGGGSIASNDSRTRTGTAFGIQLHLGGMVGKRLAILFDVSDLVHVENGVAETITGFGGPSLQFWVSERVWLKGGAGVGIGFRDGPDDIGEPPKGLGLLAAVGVELVQRERFALDLQGRFYTAGLTDHLDKSFRTNSFGAVAAVNWY